MKYNALFEYVIRTSGENTDDIDDFDDRDNFWAPVPEIARIFENVLREAHLQEMAKTGPYLFAHSIFISLKNGIKELVSALADAITRVKGTGTNMDCDKLAPYKSDPRNQKKISNEKYEDTQEDLHKFVAASYKQYGDHFSNQIPMPWDSNKFMDEATKIVCEERGVTYIQQNKEGDFTTLRARNIFYVKRKIS